MSSEHSNKNRKEHKVKINVCNVHSSALLNRIDRIDPRVLRVQISVNPTIQCVSLYLLVFLINPVIALFI